MWDDTLRLKRLQGSICLGINVRFLFGSVAGCQVRCGHPHCLALQEVNDFNFHSNAPWSLPTLLSKRGLNFAKRGNLALFGAYRARGTGPPSQRVDVDTDVDPNHPAVIQLRCFPACQELGDKKLLALHLKNSGVSMWAPKTFLSLEELETSLQANNNLFFLKHAYRERNEGVSVHLGLEACQRAWLSLPPQDRSAFVAQEEVSDLLLDDEGCKITLRIYILLLVIADEDSHIALALARRKFICRSHPLSYDAKDPDPVRHVHSTLDVFKDVDGFCSTTWRYSEAVWPAILEMFQVGLSWLQDHATVSVFNASLQIKADISHSSFQACINSFLNHFAMPSQDEGAISSFPIRS